MWRCMLNTAGEDERLKHTVELWMREQEGWSCAVESLWWSRVSSLGQQMADWFPQHRDRASSLERGWLSAAYGNQLYVYGSIRVLLMASGVFPCAHKYADSLLLYIQSEPQSNALTPAHAAPSVLLPAALWLAGGPVLEPRHRSGCTL